MPDPARYSRARLTFYALLVVATASIALAVLVASPFIPGLAWALAFAIVAYPIHRWIAARVRHPSAAAALAVAIVVVVIVCPAVFVAWQIGREVSDGTPMFGDVLEPEQWERRLEQWPAVAAVYRRVAGTVDVRGQIVRFREGLQQSVAGLARDAAAGILQLLIALFALFYFFRDREQTLEVIRSLLPMSRRESDEFLESIRAMTHATIYGTVIVSMVQGALGGLMFAWLGIPGAVLWGVVMGVLAIVPVLGAFVIWLPAAILLALQGEWDKALILTAWGTIVVGLIDNLLYPMLVGKETRLHTLPVFIAIIGGVVMFGAAGVVLGPIVLAATVSLLNILRRRTAAAGPPRDRGQPPSRPDGEHGSGGLADDAGRR